MQFAESDHLGDLRCHIVIRLVLTDERGRHLVRHWYDVLVLALPLLRPLRLLRLIPLLSVLNRRVTIWLRGRVGIYVAGGASVLAFCAALAVLDAGRSSDRYPKGWKDCCFQRQPSRPILQVAVSESGGLRPN